MSNVRLWHLFWLWVSIAVAVLVLAYSAATFPTRDRVMEMFRNLAGRLEYDLGDGETKR